MAGTKEIKRRIKSVKNTKKITKAMELVAASKMKRSVSATLASRPYSDYSWQVLTSVAKSLKEEKEGVTHPLFTKREGKNALLVHITSNRGLCGAYNAQVTKKALALLKVINKKVDLVTIGKKGDTAMRRVGQNIIASFTDLPDQITLSNILPISKFIVDEYNSLRYDQVYVTYTDFISALTQKPNVKQILPISDESLKEFIESVGEVENKTELNAEKEVNYLVEGDKSKLMGMLAEKIVRMQIYQMLLESNASEQSARMMAMKNASEASGEMINDLTLMFNKARQANITREISEISAGMASVS